MASALAEKDPRVAKALARLAIVRAETAWLELLVATADDPGREATRRRYSEAAESAAKSAAGASELAVADPDVARILCDSKRLQGDVSGAQLVDRFSSAEGQPETSSLLQLSISQRRARSGAASSTDSARPPIKRATSVARARCWSTRWLAPATPSRRASSSASSPSCRARTRSKRSSPASSSARRTGRTSPASKTYRRSHRPGRRLLAAPTWPRAPSRQRKRRSPAAISTRPRSCSRRRWRKTRTASKGCLASPVSRASAGKQARDRHYERSSQGRRQRRATVALPT